MDELQKAERASFVRIARLERFPIAGKFDRTHLLQIHAFIFQDTPRFAPGGVRPITRAWVKHRALETENLSYHVPYYSQPDLAAQIDTVCTRLAAAELLQGLSTDQFAARLAGFYAELDYLHPFLEGNSRTLRLFTRQLARQAGFNLDWHTTAADGHTRDRLYKARDVAVLRQAYPGLSRAQADALPFTPDSRKQYEAYYFALRLIEGGQTLEQVVRSAVQPLGKAVLRVVK